MSQPKIIADFTTQLSVAIAVGGTTGTLNSNLDDDGNALPTGKYYFTIDANNSGKEYITCTNTSGALTGIKTVSRQKIETSGAARAHRVGAIVEITDFATYKDYIDEATIAGIVPADTTTLGGVYTTTDTASSVVVSTDDPRLTAASMAVAVGNLLFPVGAIYAAIVSTNPATLLGFGTWTAWGTGRVPVGIDTGQTEFNTVEKTGGEKTHVLTTTEMPAHTHSVPFQSVSTDQGNNPISLAQSGTSTSGSTGGGAAHNNLQPYITCYMWKRTA